MRRLQGRLQACGATRRADPSGYVLDGARHSSQRLHSRRVFPHFRHAESGEHGPPGITAFSSSVGERSCRLPAPSRDGPEGGLSSRGSSEHCFVDESARLGREGTGLPSSYSAMSWERACLLAAGRWEHRNGSSTVCRTTRHALAVQTTKLPAFFRQSVIPSPIWQITSRCRAAVACMTAALKLADARQPCEAPWQNCLSAKLGSAPASGDAGARRFQLLARRRGRISSMQQSTMARV